MAFITLLAMAAGGLLAVVLAVAGLMEAPWQLLLLGLVAALYGLQRQIWAAERNAIDRPEVIEVNSAAVPIVGTGATTEDADAAHLGQELIYRGIRYRVPAQPQMSSGGGHPGDG